MQIAAESDDVAWLAVMKENANAGRKVIGPLLKSILAEQFNRVLYSPDIVEPWRCATLSSAHPLHYAQGATFWLPRHAATHLVSRGMRRASRRQSCLRSPPRCCSLRRGCAVAGLAAQCLTPLQPRLAWDRAWGVHNKRGDVDMFFSVNRFDKIKGYVRELINHDTKDLIQAVTGAKVVGASVFTMAQ